jgi:hypothetical protein
MVSWFVVIVLAILAAIGFVGVVALVLWATGRLKSGSGSSTSGHRGSPT